MFVAYLMTLVMFGSIKKNCQFTQIIIVFLYNVK